MRIHQWQLRGHDRAVKEVLPETAPTVVGHGIIDETMLYLTARRAEDGMLFRVFLNPDDLRRLVGVLWKKMRPQRLCVNWLADIHVSACQLERPRDRFEQFRWAHRL